MPATYPFDPTGSSASNLVVDEQNIVNANQYLNYYIVIPKFAPFFTNNVIVKYQDQNGIITTLTKGVDYDFVLPYIGATRGLGLPVYGGVVFYNLTLNGLVSLTYQTIGGEWTTDPNFVLGVLAQKAYNPRTIIWDVLTNVPSCFPPSVHYQPYDDIQGQSEVVTAILSIRDAIANKGNPLGDLAPHIADYNNPHQVTADQVNLGNVSNLALAQDTEVLVAAPVDKYITLRQLSIVCTRLLNANRQIAVTPNSGNNYFPTSDTSTTNMDVKLTEFYITSQLNWEIVVTKGNAADINQISMTGTIDFTSNDLGETKDGLINILFANSKPNVSFYIKIKAINGTVLFNTGEFNYIYNNYSDLIWALEYGVCPLLINV